jgi:threonine/homoserine/homoserine lactone efflux protein
LILDLFLIGLVVTLEPIPLSAFILLLAAERGLLKGLGFVIGWLATLVVIVALVVVVTGGKPLRPQTAPSTAALVVKLIAGAILIWIAESRRRRLSHASPSDAPKEKKQPKWMARIDEMNPFFAAGLGFLLQPWVMVAAGVTTIVEGKLNTPLEYFGVFAFALWCSASYLTLETYAALRPAVVKARLQAMLDWINTHTDQAIVFLSLFLGLYLMAKAIYGLVSGS